MLTSINIKGRTYKIDADAAPIDISIPLDFNGKQPNACGVEPAISKPCASGDLIGDTRRGGSCNFEQYTLIAHCNGTHTECVGHITHERISIRESLRDVLVPAILISVEPTKAGHTEESYAFAADAGDLVITRDALRKNLDADALPQGALIIRTMPNEDTKRSRKYLRNVPPYFTTEAMNFIVERGFDHLLVDLPSVDRLFDEGRLSNHRIFWNVEQGSFEVGEGTRRECTISELIYVPDDVADGEFVLNLQIAPFASDASPSRPLLLRTVEN